MANAECVNDQLIGDLFNHDGLDAIDFFFKTNSHNIVSKHNRYGKKRCFASSLVTDFLVANDTCNLLYLYVVNVNGQVAWITQLRFIVTQLQLCQNNSFSTTMQLHYNYTHDVMLISLIIIHLLNFDTWYYEDFWTLIFFKILISVVHYDC